MLRIGGWKDLHSGWPTPDRVLRLTQPIPVALENDDLAMVEAFEAVQQLRFGRLLSMLGRQRAHAVHR